MFVYVGTYTRSPQGEGKGIYVFRFDSESGSLTPVQTVNDIANPSFLTTSADGQRLYAVNELDEGGVTSFARDSRSGELTRLNTQPTHGADPCFITLDTAGAFAMVSNYTGGTVAIFPVTPDGSLDPASSVVAHEGSSVNPNRQGEPHPHMIAPAPDGRFVIATDLGTDEVVLYQLDSAGILSRTNQVPSAIKTAPGAGPRHFALSPNGKNLYVINELDSTVTAYSYDQGHIHSLQSLSTLPKEFTGSSTCAQIVVSPDGRFVYGSNRGHDSLAIFAIDAETGDLTFVDHQLTLGKEPRNFNIDPSGNWLLAANQHSNTIATFRRDRDSGRLTQVGALTEVPTPVAIHFV